MTKVWLGLSLVLALTVMGCGGGATHLRRGTFGGVVHVPLAADLSHAELLMAEHCGGRFDVVNGGESGTESLGGPDAGERIEYVCARGRTASR